MVEIREEVGHLKMGIVHLELKVKERKKREWVRELRRE